MYSLVFVAPVRVNQRTCGMQLKSVYVYCTSKFTQNGSNMGHPEMLIIYESDGIGNRIKNMRKLRGAVRNLFCYILHNHANPMFYINKLKTSLIFKVPIKMMWLSMIILPMVGLHLLNKNNNFSFSPYAHFNSTTNRSAAEAADQLGCSNHINNFTAALKFINR